MYSAQEHIIDSMSPGDATSSGVKSSTGGRPRPPDEAGATRYALNRVL